MTKTRTKKGVTDPFKPVKDIQFSYKNFTLYDTHQDTFNQFATETARRIIKSGSSDEFRQLHLYIVSINEWNNYAFHRIVGTAILLHDYYKIIPSYPILKGFHDAVLNAVEYSYVNWLNNELIPILPDVTSDRFGLELVLHQHEEILMRAHSWFKQQYDKYLDYVPKPQYPLTIKLATPSVTVPWMKTNLVSPVCSALLQAVYNERQPHTP